MKLKWIVAGVGAVMGLGAAAWYWWTLPPVPGLKKPA